MYTIFFCTTKSRDWTHSWNIVTIKTKMKTLVRVNLCIIIIPHFKSQDKHFLFQFVSLNWKMLIFFFSQMSFVILFMKLKFDQSLTFSKAELIIISLAVAFSMAWDMLGYIMVRSYLFKWSMCQLESDNYFIIGLANMLIWFTNNIWEENFFLFSTSTF